MRSLPQLGAVRTWEFEVGGRQAKLYRDLGGALQLHVQNRRGTWWEVARQINPAEFRMPEPPPKEIQARQIEAGLGIVIDDRADPVTWFAFRPARAFRNGEQDFVKSALFLRGRQWVTRDELEDVGGEIWANLLSDAPPPAGVQLFQGGRMSGKGLRKRVVAAASGTRKKPEVDTPLVRLDGKRGYFED